MVRTPRHPDFHVGRLSSLMATLHVLTRDAEASRRAVNAPLSVIRHENTYTCPCADCTRERAFLVDTAAHRRKAA